ncbi:hypothetical protein CFC21_021378 [Triticum aestivum]|uniref:Cytochrome P450 n=3 Tax=Triticum TaxID=4564 RepID=A0A9R1J781_WHEAT|nr:hypothetical protein CFC21_021371 [Triticum aestivum]KAF7006329.1 hypothetical protein CFC21_021378 [Triticum aestivum]VAH41432.1 unnamed protein product [Triticum turgidum subsp. durum]
MQVGDLAWWLGLLLGAVPLAALAVWRCNDAWYCAAFALRQRRWRRGRHVRLPPGHMGIPFFGETAALSWYFKVARRPDGFIEARKKRYGEGVGMYRSHLFGRPTIIVCDPAANKFVLQSHDNFWLRWPARDLLGLSSMFNVEGSMHRRIRGYVVATFSKPRSRRNIARMAQPCVVEALRSWADKGTIIAAKEIRKVMFESTLEIFISMKASPLTEKMDKWFVGVLGGLTALPLDLPGTALNHGRKCRRRLHAVFEKELQKRKNNVKWGLAAEEDYDDDLMSGLMEMEDEQGEKLSDEEVLDNIVSLVFGGYESISSAVLWAAYHLAKSPVILAKLRNENAAVSEGKSSNFLTLDDIPKMKYTAKVVEEAIRLANIAPMVHRVAYRDVEYGGYTIPQGWQVVVWLRAMHIDAKYYQDPLIFNPDRWNEPPMAGTNQLFGAGNRTCAGNMLARLQITIMLHHLSLGYEWELLNPDAGVKYIPQPMPVDGAPMAFHRLSTSTQ